MDVTGFDSPSALSLTEVRRALEAFVRWHDDVGPLSQDHMDFWAWRPGRWAKALYHRRPAVGALAVAPLALLDTFLPRTRAFVHRPTRFPIADAHYAIAFFALARFEGDDAHARRASLHLEALEGSRCAGYDERCWGYPFTWETCVGTWERGRPLITQTPYGYEAYAAAQAWRGDRAYAEAMQSVAAFAMRRIPSEQIRPGVSVSAYTPSDTRRVVNANAYRAYLLIDAGVRFSRPEWLHAGRDNLGFVLDTQRPDGSWPYAVDGHDAFVDNFHTCFVLKNLLKAWRLVEEEEILLAIRRGYGYYKERLLDEDGDPIPFATAQRTTLFMRELYDYAEGLNLALLLRDVDPQAEAIAEGLARALVREYALPDGHFVTRRHRLGRNTVPYHRWAQAQAFHALVDFLLARAAHGPEEARVVA